MAIEAGGGDGLGEDDADGDEDGAAAGSEGHGDFDARAFGVLIAAAEAEAAFGQILANDDFLLKTAAADAGEHACLDARAVAARDDAVFHGRLPGAVLHGAHLGLRLDPDGRRVAMLANTGDAFADFEGLELQLVEISDLAALAEAAFHQKTRESFFGLMWGREFDLPEVRTCIQNVDGVEEAVGLLVDFSDDAGAGAFPLVAFALAAEVEFLAHGQLIGEAKDAAVAADEQSLGGLFVGRASAGDPGCLDGHAEADAVTLAKAIRYCGHRRFEKSLDFSLARKSGAERPAKGVLSFQLIRTREHARGALPGMVLLVSHSDGRQGSPLDGSWCKLFLYRGCLPDDHLPMDPRPKRL